MNRRFRDILILVPACLISALTAYVVADQQSSESGRSPGLGVGELEDNRFRATATLETRTIRPGVTFDAYVIASDGGFRLAAPVSPQALLYDLLETPPVAVKGLVEGGPAGFDCAWVGAVQLNGEMTVQCDIPADLLVVEGLTGTFLAQTEPPTDGSALPLSAVIGRTNEGLVVVVGEEGSLSVREVDLGRSDSFAVEITSGLQPNEQVLLFPTQLDLEGLGT